MVSIAKFAVQIKPGVPLNAYFQRCETKSKNRQQEKLKKVTSLWAEPMKRIVKMSFMVFHKAE